MICSKCKNHWSVPKGKALGNCPQCGENSLLMLNDQFTNPEVEVKLQNLIIAYGHDLLNDKKRLSAMINDLFHFDNHVKRILILSIINEIPIRLFSLYRSNTPDLLNQISTFRKNINKMAFWDDEVINDMFQYWTRTLNSLKLLTKAGLEDGEWIDGFGVKFSSDRRKLIKGKKITSYYVPSGTETICDNAFASCNSLTDISLPNSIIEIGIGAFYKCSNLKSIFIPPNVYLIGEGAFYTCDELMSIEVDNSNSYFYSIDGVLYERNSNTLLCYPSGKHDNTFSIPSDVPAIGPYAFAFSNLEIIEIPNSVISIGKMAFYYNWKLKEITLPDSLNSIGERSFLNSWRFKSISIPSSVISIGEGAFKGCSWLANIFVNEFNHYFTSIEGVLFSADLKTIICFPIGKCKEGEMLRYGWVPYEQWINQPILIDSYTLPFSVEEIGASAFVGCGGLKKIILSSSLTIVNSSAFFGCEELMSLEIDDQNQSYCSIDGILYDKSKSTIVYHPIGKSKLECTFSVPDSVLTIGKCAFQASIELTHISLSESVMIINDLAFSYCRSLRTIDIPSSVTSIGSKAFLGCDNMTSISLPSSLFSIGDDIFKGCDILEEIQINFGNHFLKRRLTELGYGKSIVEI